MRKLSQLFLPAWGVALILAVACAPASPTPTTAPAKPAEAKPGAAKPADEGQALLGQLIDRAKNEKELVIGFPSNITPGWAKTTMEVFNKRFGLNIALASSQAESRNQAVQALAEHKQGVTPSFDVLEGGEVTASGLVEAGAVRKIENWEKILKAIDPMVDSKFASAGPLEGYQVFWGHRPKVMTYRTDLLREEELPRTYLDLADPKYKGRYSVPPFLTDTQILLLGYEREVLLKAVETIGQSVAFVATYDQARDRMMLGEIQFMPDNADGFFKMKGKDPNAPIGLAFWKDFVPLSHTGYLVRAGNTTPNAAQLFALWTATSEANKLWEEEFGQSGSFAAPTSKIGSSLKKDLQEKRIPLVSFLEGKGPEILKWLATQEGQAYSDTLSKAQLARQRS